MTRRAAARDLTDSTVALHAGARPRYLGTRAPVVLSTCRIRHAAHYPGIGGGHDLEEWVVRAETITAARLAPGLPDDAEYRRGFRDFDDSQCWEFVRRAPLAEGCCKRCAPNGAA